MTTDVGFLYSAVAVSMSLSSLAGLVIAFRRTGVWAAHDVFRLRQIVEWGFANVVLALLAFPLSGLLGSETAALRVTGAIALVYVIANLLVLKYRLDHMQAPLGISYTPLIFALDVSLLMLTTSTAIVGTMTAWEITLLLLIARPMLAFVYVLGTLGRETPS